MQKPATFAPVQKHQLISALSYAWNAQTIYDVHAPRAFSFIGEVIEDNRHFYAFDIIKGIRKAYLDSSSILTLQDHGAGSLAATQLTKPVAQIARQSGSPERFGEYLLKTVDWSGATHMLELGTNLGLGTCYLAGALPSDGRLISIDADPGVLTLARKSVEQIPTKGEISLIEGKFADVLANVLQELERVDLAFIDGHHEEEATKRYFSQIRAYSHSKSVIILDDIHWSPGMENAWEWVKQQQGVSLTIDLYRWGIVFFEEEILVPQHLTIAPWKWKPWHMGFFSSRAV